MLNQVHEHVVSELNQGARTDTVFVVVSVLFDLVVLGINWSVADHHSYPVRVHDQDPILALLVLVTLAINFFVIRALVAGRQTRLSLVSGLIAMYKDNGVDKYYDARLLDTYATRYALFISVIVSLALVSIAVPLLVRFS